MKNIKNLEQFNEDTLNESQNWEKVANALDTLSQRISKINDNLSSDIKKLDEKLNNIIFKNNLKY